MWAHSPRRSVIARSFADAIREALGRESVRPKGYENIEALPQRLQLIEPDAVAVKRYIEAHAA